MELITGDESIYGYRKLTLCLKRQYGLIINKKKVYRLCRELDILQPQRRKRIHYPRKLAITGKSVPRINFGKWTSNTAILQQSSVSFSYSASLTYMIVPSSITIWASLAKASMPRRFCSGRCRNDSSLRKNNCR
ncbi:transposase [Paenibacillus piri]